MNIFRAGGPAPSIAACLALALPLACAAQKYTITDVGTLGGNSSGAQSINAASEITGFAYTAGNASSDVFLYAAGKMTNLGTLGGTAAIEAHAFLYTAGTMKDLGTLQGTSTSWGLAINNSGVVVGQSDIKSNATYHAFVASGGRMQDLNNLIPLRSGWVLISANGINDAGQIVGMGMHNGQEHAFLLTPQ